MFLPELPEGLGWPPMFLPELPDEGYIILVGTLILLLQLVVTPLLIDAGKCILISSITSAICYDTLNCTDLTSSLIHHPFFLGCIAVKVQSLLRIVVSGSIFAILQSAGMGRYGAKVIADILTYAGFLTVYVGVVLAACSMWKP